jgi:Arc/MetJ-type ribon-helix-helix transcriptional regulator
MSTIKVAITLDPALLSQLDRLIAAHVFPSRSQAIQAALRDKLARIDRALLAAECAKLDPKIERQEAEDGMAGELESWPAY